MRRPLLPARAPAPAAIALGALLSALLSVAAAPPLAAQGPERHTLRADAVAIYNLAGRVRVVGTSGRDVQVEVDRGGRDARDLRIAKGERGDRETLRVVYPDRDVVYPALGRSSRTTLNVRDDGTFGDGETSGGFFGRGRNSVTIRGSGSGTEAWADMTIEVPRGRTLSLFLAVGEATVSNVDGDLRIDVSSASVSTDRTRGRLHVDAGSGGLRVSNADGEVNLDTGSGSVRLDGIRGPRLMVDAGSGSITGSDVDVPSIDLDLGSGGTRLERVRTRDMRLDTGSGNVDVELVDDVDRLTLDSGSGSVTLRIPTSLGATIDAETGSGGIDARIPLTISRQSRSRVTGRVGDGRGTITIDSGSGTVRLLRS